MTVDRFAHSAEFFSGLAEAMPQTFLERIFERAILRQPARLLEVGCGSGEIAKWFAAKGIAVDAVDLSEHMLEVARRDYRGNARFHCADAVKVMSSAQAKWDAVVAFESFHLLLDDPALPAALRNALSTGGRLIVAWRALEWEESCHDIITCILPQFGVPFDDWGFWECPNLDEVLEAVGRPWIEHQAIHVSEAHSSTVDDVLHFVLGIDRVQDLDQHALARLRQQLEQELSARVGESRQFSGSAIYSFRTVEFESASA